MTSLKPTRLEELLEIHPDFPEAHFYYDDRTGDFTTTYAAERIGMRVIGPHSPQGLFQLLQSQRWPRMSIEQIKAIEVTTGPPRGNGTALRGALEFVRKQGCPNYDHEG